MPSTLARVLVCEDDPTMLTILRFHLKIKGVDLVFVEDGKQAVEAFENEAPFDLVISDLLMPELSGIDFIRYLREQVQSKIPVIAISGGDNLKEIEEVSALGIQDFVAKPFRPREIALRLRILLEKSYPDKFDL